jgi:hypothetical protein
MEFVYVCENRTMNSVEIFLTRGRGMRENDGRGESKIYCKHIGNYPTIQICILLYKFSNKLFANK